MNIQFVPSYNYYLRDYLGSITHLTYSNGNVLQEQSYDAWGRQRNPSSLVVYATSTVSPTLGRGYTGHEFVPYFGFVNMNARLYDPAVGRFLSPDPFVQTPDNPQNFNRYSYCLNNPLKYTDESGEFLEWVILGAFLGGTLNLGYQVYRGNISDVGDALFAFGVGAAAVAASAYTGGIAFSLAGGGGRWCGRLFGRIRTRSGRRNHFNSNHQ